MSLFSELKRRNVIRVGALYIVVGWLLVQVADVLFPWFGIPDWAGRLIVLVLVLGFPVAVVFAWAYEITPDGIKRESEVDPDRSIAPHTAKKLDYITIGAVVLAVVFVIADRFIRPTEAPVAGVTMTSEPAVPVEAAAGQPESSETSIAVLPFVNMSEDEANEYFSDGISEELLNLLVRVKGLRVPSRTSSFAFKGTNTDIPTIAEKLDVDHVLEGSVRKAGNTVRITAQLIDVADDRHLWSDTYDRELEDIFAVQDEIATAIVEALKGLLGTAKAAPVQHRPPTDNVEAYELYLRGQHLWRQRGAENLNKAIGYFQEALALDPGFARVLSALATTYTLVPVYTPVDPEPWWTKARQAALDALELDPTLGEANATLAALHQNHWEWQQAELAFQKATAADPHDVTATQWYGEFLAEIGRFDDGETYIRKAHDLDPLAPVVIQSLAYVYSLTGQFDAAREELDAAEEIGFAGASPYIIRAFMHMQEGNYEKALKEFEQGVGAGHGLLQRDVDALRAVVNPELWPTMREQLDTFPDGAVHQGMDPVVYYMVMGENETVFKRLERSLETGELWLPDYFWAGAAEIRRDPRFVAAMERAGLIDYWRQYGWPSFCSETNGEVTCE